MLYLWRPELAFRPSPNCTCYTLLSGQSRRCIPQNPPRSFSRHFQSSCPVFSGSQFEVWSNQSSLRRIVLVRTGAQKTRYFVILDKSRPLLRPGNLEGQSHCDPGGTENMPQRKSSIHRKHPAGRPDKPTCRWFWPSRRINRVCLAQKNSNMKG